MNPNIPLEIFLPPEPEWSHINALVTNDHHGLNNGVFFLRVNEWSVWLMAATVAWKIYKPDIPLRFHDQTALGFLLDTVSCSPLWSLFLLFPCHLPAKAQGHRTTSEMLPCTSRNVGSTLTLAIAAKAILTR
jgi:hypothetical protein